MKTTPALFSFLGFLFSFLAALTARFYHSIYLNQESLGYFLVLLFFLVLGAYFLGLTCKYLSTRTQSAPIIFGVGFIALFPIFLILCKIESTLSQNLLLSETASSTFAEINGHCGVYAGRAILRVYDRNLRGNISGALRDYEIGNQCRLKHFSLLESENLLRCSPQENKIDCSVRWMNAFTEKGLWNYKSRLFFYEKVAALAESVNHKEESMLNYALKDQELEMSRQSLLKQVGLDESGSNPPQAFLDAEELQHLELTLQVLNKVQEMTKDLKGRPSPQLLRFRDLYPEFQQKKNRLEELKKRVSYSPAQ
jgi:hypothetical protein